MEVLPFPKSQSHDVGDPVEASWNLTTSGAQPCTVPAVKSAESCALPPRQRSKRQLMKKTCIRYDGKSGTFTVC